MPLNSKTSIRRFRQWRDQLLIPAWKITFAFIAIVDIFSCQNTLLEGWNVAMKQSEPAGSSRKYKTLEFLSREETTPANVCSTVSAAWNWIGPLFCCLCMIEAAIRAKEARQWAFENAALDNFEKKLAEMRCNVFRQQPRHDNYDEDANEILARNTFRSWAPVATILTFWFILLPWKNLFGHQCEKDTALATIWVTYFTTHINDALRALQSEFFSLLWRLALPFNVLQPKRLYKRFRQIVRWIRYVRFAGPLLRISLKLNDQFVVVLKTRSQFWQARAQKARRLAKRSLLLDDIQRIESLAKLQTALASFPSQMFHLAQKQATQVGNIFATKKEEGRKLRRRLDGLKNQVRIGSNLIPSSELYDQILELTQELTTTVSATVLSSYLISPQTRFSVGWRVIVTFALLTELFRLYASFQISGTFDVSLTNLISSLLIECDQKRTERFRFLIRRGRSIRSYIGKTLGLPNMNMELAKCLPSSSSSKLFLFMGGAMEFTINIVCFLDIFVWFFTGELDLGGVVVPKPFFARCILPGTLVQVLDHPTLPDKLPELISYLIGAASAAGYSRVFRWALALFPAFDMLVVDPLKSYWFRPMDDNEWLSFNESFAMIPVLSGSNIRNSHNMMGMRRTENLPYPSPSSPRKQDSFFFMDSLQY